jgi:predicted nucleic acid-binding protein
VPQTLCALLDANIIIEIYTHKCRELLQSRVTLVIPSIVRTEARLIVDEETNTRRQIVLDDALLKGSIKEVAATTGQMQALYARFDRVFVERMQAGEAEALALLLASALPDHLLGTADGPAIRALSMLDMRDSGISLEKLLNTASIALPRPLRRRFTEAFFREQAERGSTDRITGTGLAKPASQKRKRGKK